MTVRIAPIAAAILCLGRVAPASGQRPLNLGFELRSVSYPDRPWGWSLGWSAFAAGPAATFTLDDSTHFDGARSLRITAADTGRDAPARAITLPLHGAFGRGAELRLTGQVRAVDLAGRASLSIEAWREGEVAAGDTATVSGSPDGRWMPVSLSIRVPADPGIHSVVVTAAVSGAGTAWFDGLELHAGGKALQTAPADPPPPVPAEVARLARRTAPLRQFRLLPPAARDDRELEPFSRIVGDARIVGLGESTHGTHEFFQLKHRLVEYLVRRHGFDVFAVEANQLATERLNAWVLGGPGTAREVLGVLFRVWNTEEMLDLIEWMRRHNETTPARPVRFIGYDMQDHRTPIDSLRAFAARTDPALLARVDQLTREYAAERSYATPQVAEPTRLAWSQRADSLWSEVSARRAGWLAESRTRADSTAAEWAVHAADLLRQAARFNVALSSPERDSLMAANLDWSLRTLYPSSRAVVWAHDVHVARGGDTARSFNAGEEMGAHLKHAYGHDYRAFSLLTRAGRYTATRSFSDHEYIAAQAFPAPPGSVEAVLAEVARGLSSPGSITDTRVPEGTAWAWWWRSRPIRHIGYAAYDYAFDLRAVMPLDFDGIFFIDTTTPSRLLR